MTTPATRNWTRPKADDCHITDDARLTTGPGRYILEAPSGYANASFVPEPTTRQQKWGAAQVETFTKTDVESDLWNINRGTTREICGLYDPNDNRMNSASKKTIKEASFPQTHARLNDPPCTLRGSGWNRFEWLCQNPQERAMMPFDWFIPGRILHKDAHRPCIPTPISAKPVLPAPLHISPDVVNVPGAYGTSMAEARALGLAETPARVLPANSLKSVQSLENNSENMLLDGRDVMWPESGSTNYVKFPVPTGPPSVAWQRNDYSQGLYNTNTTPTSSEYGNVLPGPTLKTIN
jgi:hypothetical protein